MDLSHIAVRAVVAYVYLLLMTRMSGKRVVSQATPFDLLVSLIVGDLIDDGLWAEIPVAKFAVAVGTIFVIDAIVRIAAQRSSWVDRLVCGTPAIVLRHGIPDDRALRQEQMNRSDLAHLTRLNGIENKEEVRMGIVEDNHDLAVLKEPWAEPLQRRDADAVRKLIE
jgi:uncharacterized membrane protein YcaP (DUF421 family)